MIKFFFTGFFLLALTNLSYASDQWSERLNDKMNRALAKQTEPMPFTEVEFEAALKRFFPSEVLNRGAEKKTAISNNESAIFHHLSASISQCKSVLDILNHDQEENFQTIETLVPILQNIPPTAKSGYMSQGAHLCALWDVYAEFYETYSLLTLWKKKLFPQDTIRSYQPQLIDSPRSILPDLIKKWEEFDSMLPELRACVLSSGSSLDGSQLIKPLVYCLSELHKSTPKEVHISVGRYKGKRKLRSRDAINETVNKISKNSKQFQDDNDNIRYLTAKFRYLPSKLSALFLTGCPEIPFPMRNAVYQQEFPDQSDDGVSWLRYMHPIRYISKLEEASGQLRRAYFKLRHPYEDPFKLGVLRFLKINADRIENPFGMYLYEGSLMLLGNMMGHKNPFMLTSEPFDKKEMRPATKATTKPSQEKPLSPQNERALTVDNQSKKPLGEEKGVLPDTNTLPVCPAADPWIKKEEIVQLDRLIEEAVEAETYDAEYWRRENAKYQDQKKKVEPCNLTTTSLSGQRILTPYEEDLFAFIRTYAHQKQKITWRVLSTRLKELKFSLVPNNIGTGSCYFVKPMLDNTLFGEGTDFIGSYFNIHKFPDPNTPIHPKYLRFLDSGFSNVFGLSEEYLSSFGM